MAANEGFEEFDRFCETIFAGMVGDLALVTNDLHEAEDLAQEALAQAAVHWTRLRDCDPPEARAWVYRTALSLALARRRLLAAFLQPSCPSAGLATLGGCVGIGRDAPTGEASSEDRDMTVVVRGALQWMADEFASSARPPDPAIARQRARWLTAGPSR